MLAKFYIYCSNISFEHWGILSSPPTKNSPSKLKSIITISTTYFLPIEIRVYNYAEFGSFIFRKKINSSGIFYP